MSCSTGDVRCFRLTGPAEWHCNAETGYQSVVLGCFAVWPDLFYNWRVTNGEERFWISREPRIFQTVLFLELSWSPRPVSWLCALYCIFIFYIIKHWLLWQAMNVPTLQQTTESLPAQLTEKEMQVCFWVYIISRTMKHQILYFIESNCLWYESATFLY